MKIVGLNLDKKILFLVLNLFWIAGIISLQLFSLQNNFSETSAQKYSQQVVKKKAQLNLINKIPLLGFDNIIADWLFLNFIQYYGDNEARETTGYGLAPDYFQTIVKLEPRFIVSYFFLEPATTLFALQPQISVTTISQGLEFISPDTPLASELWIIKAINELLFLGNTQAATNSYRQALEWTKKDKPQVNPNKIKRLEETIKFLESDPDSRRAAAGGWAALLSRARDTKTKEKILYYLDRLGAEVILTPTSITVKLPEEK
jgi:hypothetical protein